jgi:hypothetical protein
MPKNVPPSQDVIAFDCPHCGAYTTHTWYKVFAERLENPRVPGTVDPDILQKVDALEDFGAEEKTRFKEYFEKLMRGFVFLERNDKSTYVNLLVGNVHLSKCFACSELAVWVNGSVISPAVTQGPAPNADLPVHVLDDYNEASRVLWLSPRSAAGLLRLCIQKLCAALGEKGKNIDDDVASLVKKGLSPVVQQALDAVRVIGNEAVHPGTIDLKDDIETAVKLFSLVNIIAEQMISNPKHVRELYEKLPETKRAAIDKRDGRT